MKQYGLIGKTLTHSYSADYFRKKISALGLNDVSYDLFPISNLNELKKLLTDNPYLKGLGVTIPFKIEILNYLNTLDVSAKAIGAVNTLKIERLNDKIILKGYNTDYSGFIDSLKSLDFQKHKKALILGTGGASKAVAYALDSLKIDFLFVSRQLKNEKTINYNELNKDIITDYTFIINATPLGMYPDTESCPEIPYQYIGKNHLLYDLVYNPEITAFLLKGLQQNAYICNGLDMLYRQAEYSWKIWNDEVF